VTEDLKVKIAKDPRAALVENTIESVEKAILSAELELEINRAVVAFLKTKRS